MGRWWVGFGGLSCEFQLMAEVRHHWGLWSAGSWPAASRPAPPLRFAISLLLYFVSSFVFFFFWFLSLTHAMLESSILLGFVVEVVVGLPIWCWWTMSLFWTVFWVVEDVVLCGGDYWLLAVVWGLLIMFDELWILF